MLQHQDEKGWYDTAQICLNGHLVNASTKASPVYNSKFCDKCGAATITKCPKCKADIPGQFHATGVFTLSFPMHTAPSFCSNCGSPYPWTERRLEAAHELASEISGLEEAERDILSQSIDALIADTPQTQVAAVRFKKMMLKVGQVGADAFREILVDIVSEAAKKMIWG